MRTVKGLLITLLSLFLVEKAYPQAIIATLDGVQEVEEHEAGGPPSPRAFPRMEVQQGNDKLRILVESGGNVSHELDLNLSSCASASLDGCQDEIDNNLLQLCKVPFNDPSIEKRAVGGSERQLLASFFLKVIRGFSPRDSLTEGVMKGERKTMSVGDLFGHGAMAGIAYVLAGLALIGTICLVIQIYCCKYCGGGCWRRPNERRRSSKLTVIITFGILLFLFLLFYFGAVYYTSWLRKDMDSAACTLHRVARELLFSPSISSNSSGTKGNLFGIQTFYKKSLDTSQSMLLDFGDGLGVRFPTHLQFVFRNMGAAFAPLLFTNAMLQLRTFQGWPRVAPEPAVPGLPQKLDTGIQSSFNLDLELLEADQGAALSSLSQAFADYSTAVKNIASLNVASNDSKQKILDAESQLSTLRDAIHNASSHLVGPYNKFVAQYHYKTDHSKAEKAAYGAIVAVTVLTVVLVLGGVGLFVYYLLTNQHEEPLHHQGSFMTYFAGFLTFASFLWAILLLILAAVIFLLAVPIADGCQFANKALHKNITVAEYPKLSKSVNASLFQTCVQGANEGRLSHVYNLTDSSFSGMEDVKIPFTTLKSIRGMVKPAPLASFKALFTARAKLPGYVASKAIGNQIFALGEGEALLSCATPPAEAQVFCDDLSHGSGITNPSLVGLAGLTKQLSKLLQIDNLCIGEAQKCPSGSVLVNRETVRNVPSDSDIFNGALARAAKSLSKPDQMVAASLARTAVALSLAQGSGLERSTMSGSLPELLNIGFLDAGFSDPCPPGDKCPIFFLFRNPANISDGLRLVDYGTWQQHWREETLQAVDQVATDADMTAFISRLGVKDSTLRGFSDAGREIVDNDHCSVVAVRAEEVRRKVCDDAAGNFVGLAFLWFFIALILLAGGVMCMLYWTARRRYREPGSRRKQWAGDRPISAVAEPARLQHEFMAAAAAGDVRKVQECVERYPPGTVKDEFGNEPLHLAAYYGHAEVASVLLRAGHDPNALNYSRYSPLGAMMTNMSLATSKKAEIAEMLKLGGADLEIVDYQGNSPLMARTKLRDVGGVKVLVDLGADPQKPDEYNVTPAALARRLGDEELVRLLILNQRRGSALAEVTAADFGAHPQSLSGESPELRSPGSELQNSGTP